MQKQLNSLMVNEYNTLKKLLELLEEQHGYCISKNIFAMEDIVGKIENVNKLVAKLELERRKLVGERNMSELVRSFQDEELDNNYRKVKLLLDEIRFQKEANEQLIKQGLIFTNKMLNLISPGKNANLYNAKGALSR